MKLFPKSILPEKEVKKFIVIFYIVGFLGFILPFSRPLFMTITPLALLLNIYLLLLYHHPYNLKTLLVFCFIMCAGYGIEVLGVKTGLIFGSYRYGSALGFKLWETPLLIGVNWLFMTYASSAVAHFLKLKKALFFIIAPAIMLAYDVVLEQLAPRLGMWQWAGGEVPLRNYLAWYILGFFFILLMKKAQINTRNTFALLLFVAQFVFFTFLFCFKIG